MYFNNDGTKKILKKTALISTGRFFLFSTKSTMHRCITLLKFIPRIKSGPAVGSINGINGH